MRLIATPPRIGSRCAAEFASKHAVRPRPWNRLPGARLELRGGSLWCAAVRGWFVLLAAGAVLTGAGPAQAADDKPCLPPYDEPGYGIVQKCPIFVPKRGHVPVHGFNGTAPVEVSRLVAGGTANWFVCQTDQPERIVPDRYIDADYPQLVNRWWAKTQGDGSATWGWVNEIYFSGGLNDEPDAGLRRCGAQDAGGPPPPPTITPPPAPVPSPPPVDLGVGILCTPAGSPITVRLAVHRRAGRKRPHVIKVVFFIKRGGGGRRVDRKAPYRRAIPVDLAPGTKGRVYARVHYRRPGERRVHTRTVSRRFQICGN
jgi:hypothetical protein